MAAEKIINKNFPYTNALSQMNYENGVQLGDGDIGDLYTLVDEYDVNETNIMLYPDGQSGGVMWMYGGSYIEVIGCNIASTGVNYDTISSKFAVYLVDDRYDDNVIDANTGTDIRDNVIYTGNNFDGQAGIDYLLYYKYIGDRAKGQDIGEIWNNGGGGKMKIIDVPAVSSHCDDNTCNSPVGFIAMDKSLLNFSDDIGDDGYSSYYIIVRCGGNADDPGEDNDIRNSSYFKYRLPKKLLRDMWLRGENYKNNTEDAGNYEIFAWGKEVGDVVGINNDKVTYKVGNNSPFMNDDYDDGDDETYNVTSPAFKSTYLAVKVYPPQWNMDDIPTSDNPSSNLEEDYTWEWIDTDDNSDHIRLRPDNLIDYTNLILNNDDMIYPDDFFDFRPISYVTVDSPVGDIDIQSWYDFGDYGFIYGTAPNIIKLSFDISENVKSSTFTLNYFDYDPINNSWKLSSILSSIPNIGFKFFVIDWESDTEEIGNWENNIINKLPTNYTELNNNRGLYDTYFYTDLFNGDGSYNYLEHEYNDVGIKIIKALIFSYIKHPLDETHIQSVRWKAVSIKINLNYDTNVLEDFAEIGGSDFTYIPWPYTIPIVGGISNESGYINSVENILSENKFNDDEMVDYYRTLVAYNNKPGGELDELGDYFGKSDIAQIRYFKDGKFDMNDLLDISNFVSSDGVEFNGYDNFDYWYGDPCTHSNLYVCSESPTYPINSSVGTIFINDSYRQDLRDNCILEMNINEVDNNLISDSNGNDKKGIIIGDYNLKKSEYGDPIARISLPLAPEIDDKNGAF